MGTETQEVLSGPSKAIEPYLTSLLGRSQALVAGDTKKQWEKYTGKRFADFTAAQKRYFNTALSKGIDPRSLDAANLTKQGINKLLTQQYKAGTFTQTGKVTPKQQQTYLMGNTPKLTGQGDWRNSINKGLAAQGVYNQQLNQYGMRSADDIAAPKDWKGRNINTAQGKYTEKLNQYGMEEGKGIAQLKPWQAKKITAAQDSYKQKLKDFDIEGIENVVAPKDLDKQTAKMKAAQTGFKDKVGTKSFTTAAAQAGMSPYMQSVVAIQQREAQRQADIAGTERSAKAVQAGAFGGSRQAIMDAEAARNLEQQKGDIQAQGSQKAYEDAQQQFNQQEQLRLTAQQSNQQTGLQAALANMSSRQQASVQNQAAINQSKGMSAQMAMQAAIQNQQTKLQQKQSNQRGRLETQALSEGNRQQLQVENLRNRQQTELTNVANQLMAEGASRTQAIQIATTNLQDKFQRQSANQQAKLQVQALGSGNRQQLQMLNVQNMQQSAITNEANALMREGATRQQAIQIATQNQQQRFNREANNQQANLQVQALGSGNLQQLTLQNLQNMQQSNMSDADRRFQALMMSKNQAFEADKTNIGNEFTRNQLDQAARYRTQEFGAGQDLTAQQYNLTNKFERERAAEASRQYGADYGYRGSMGAVQGAGQLANIGQNIYGQDVNNINYMRDIGQQHQNFNQRTNDVNYQNFQDQRNFPYQEIEFERNMISGIGNSMTSKRMYESSPSMFNQVVGAGAAYLGAQQNAGISVPVRGAAGGMVPSGLMDLAMNRAYA